jgi:cephalosporin-C deacetylase-like acetyl esterase
MERPDHLFLEQEAIVWDLLVENGQKKVLEGELRVKGASDFGQEVMDMTSQVKVRPGRTRAVRLEAGILPPGFYDFTATLTGESGTVRREFSLGVRPESIVSAPSREDDFTDYWRRARRELDAVEPQFRLIRQDDLCTDTREIFLLEMRSLGNILIRGWYMRPVKEGVYPALLHVQGYSSTMSPASLYPGDDMVALALNIRGHGNSRDHLDPGFPGYLLHNIGDKEVYIYRGAYMDCVRAVDFLYSRSEVDTSRVAVLGGSQGGALSFATAALDPERIDLCVPHVPFLSDFPDYFRIASWPGGEVFRFLEETGISQEEAFHTLSYIDIKNLAPWIQAPVHMAIGLRDRTCPPHINFAAYNQLSVEKRYIVYPEAGHGLPPAYHLLKYQVIREQFGLDK